MKNIKSIKNIALYLLLFLITAGLMYYKTSFYFPLWAVFSKNNKPVKVLDTNSSLGRYSKLPKNITLKDMAKMHGHLCDGLVIVYLELKEGLYLLFKDKVVDRTDIRVVTKNGPCWVDGCSFLTGARINFKTLSINNNLKNSIIVQKISTGETYQISLKDGVFPLELEQLENEIKNKGKLGQKVEDKEIMQLEKMANAFSKMLLSAKPSEILDVKELKNYKYYQNIQTGIRTDIINK